MALIIRHAAPDDETSVVDLWRDCALTRSHNDPGADFRFALAGACSTVLVGVSADGSIQSSAMVGHDGHRGWVYYVACAPVHRKHGSGRQIMQAAEEWLRDQGVAKLQLMVRETNTAVVPFYERLGFVIEPRVVLSKRLSEAAPGPSHQQARHDD